MARIVDNQDGRRMIRLTTDDVLTVVSLYQQHLYEVQNRNHDGIRRKLAEMNVYLPEDC